MLAFPGYIIHLKDKTERLPLLESLQKASGLSLTIFNALTRADWSKKIPSHPWRHDVLTDGMIGCSLSHLAVLNLAGKSQQPTYIFEDDVQVLKPFSPFLYEMISSNLRWDIILLGANEYVSSEHLANYKGIRTIHRFWGTHAMLVHPSVIQKIRTVFDSSVENDIFLPADWLYNEAIKIHGLRVYGPADPKEFVIQAPGFISAITGRQR